MKLMEVISLIVGISLIITLVGLIGCVKIAKRNFKQTFEETKVEVIDMLSKNYQVIKGIIESPSVIIIVETFTEFKQKCEELDTKTVYYDRDSDFYVFNDDLSIAWRFRIKLEPISSLSLKGRWTNQ